jgi:hypothetical protein
LVGFEGQTVIGYEERGRCVFVLNVIEVDVIEGVVCDVAIVTGLVVYTQDGD